MQLSSITIAKNEERNIRRCISSVKSFADEIIVLVDSESEDKTLQIVKEENVKYEVVDWEGFSKTKQRGVSIAENDWIFWIDADEVVSDSLQKEILEWKYTEPGFEVYSFPRKANFLGRWIEHSGWYPGRVTRLFDKNKISFNENSVHEGLNISGDVGKFENDFLHFTDPNIFHYFQKFNKYTSLAAEELNAKNKKFKLSDILIRPLFLFFKMFILKLGFRDGIQGFMLAVFSSLYVFSKYAKLWEIQKKSEEQ